MRKFKGTAAAEARGGNEKLKLLMMAVGLGLVVIAYFMTAGGSSRSGVDEGLAPTGRGQVALPQLLPGTLEAFDDSTEEARVRLEREPLEVVLAHARQLTRAHIEALEVEPLGVEALAALEAEPAAHRGRFYSARGEIVALTGSEPEAITEHLRAALRLDDGSLVHALVPRLEDPGLGVGDWARFDGMFVKRFTDEVGGEWRTGPLLVGPRLNRSFPDFGTVTEIPDGLWDEVRDDTLDGAVGDFEELRWRALAMMRDVPFREQDWEQAPILDAAAMEALAVEPERFRGRRFRVPVGLLLHLTRKSAGENPARLEEYTEGWMWRTDYSERARILKFLAPGDQRNGLGKGSKATVDLLFLRNVSYVASNNTRRVVPLFVAARVAPYDEPLPIGLIQLIWGFIGITLVLTVAIIVLWRRDQKRSAALQEKLLERRRARRARTASSGA